MSSEGHEKTQHAAPWGAPCPKQRTIRCAVLLKTTLSLAALGCSNDASKASEFSWDLPEWFAEPDVPADNPMSPAKVELGRHLFYDPRLSVTGTQSCATCHDPARAFTDGRSRPVGATGQEHVRSAPSLVNLAYATSLTWVDPELRSLEQQALLPLLGEHPIELGMMGRESELLDLLIRDETYEALREEAFPKIRSPRGREAADLTLLLQALAAFERTLISGNSPFDRYLDGDAEAIDASARVGMKLFYSERTNCFRCHGGFNFDAPSTGAGPAPAGFHNTGLYDLDGQGSYPSEDPGLYATTGQHQDMGRFKTPTLRNIDRTAPYMHDGSVPTLEAVLDHYMAGGRIITDGPHAGVGQDSPHKSPLVSGFSINEDERRGLLAFLRSLTDEEFLNDERLDDPW